MNNSAIQNSQHRMYAMLLIDKKLYQSDNLATIDMKMAYQRIGFLLAGMF
jgi:two-component sensor histidine kinase